MTMFHDTFCTPSTFDKHNIINEITCANNNTLRVDTLFRSPNNNCTSPLPPSLRSSNSSLTTASSTSSDDSSIMNDDYHKLALWVQGQLGFYTTLSILPSRIPCPGDGKLLLCLIHRFAPHSLPHLVATLEQHTSTECLVLADDLAQQLWQTTFNSLAVYLHRHYHNTSMTLGDHIDSLISFPLSSSDSSTPDQKNDKEHLLCDDDDDDNHHAQRPAIINAATLPIWQHRLNDDGPTTTATKWISATHQSIDSYLHHPRTHRFSVLLSLLDQLKDIYVDFTRLTTTLPAPAPGYLLPTRQLLGRLQLMDDPCAILTKPSTDGVDDNDHLAASLSDILVQRHAWLQTAVQHTLGLFEKTNNVQTWIMAQQKLGKQVDGRPDECKAWLDSMRRYQQEDHDVLALTEYASSSFSGGTTDRVVVVGRVARPTVIKVLDSLDTLIAQSKQVAQRLHWHSMAAEWEYMHVVASTGLVALKDSVEGLIQQTKWNNNNKSQVAHRLLVQQWKILSTHVAHMENGDYATLVCLYQQLILAFSSSSSRMTDVDSDYDAFIEKWKQLHLDLDSARQGIAQHKRIEDFLHQCHMVQNKATELEGQLGVVGGINLYEKLWLDDQVGELDDTISRVLVLAGDFGDDAIDLVHYWKVVLEQCKLVCHQALVGYESRYTGWKRQQELKTIKHIMTGQLNTLKSSLFDPWTHCVDDVVELKRGYSERKRQFMRTMVARFDEWIKNGGGEGQSAVAVHSGIEKGQQLLVDYADRLDILEKRHTWEKQWYKASTWIQHTFNTLHALMDSGGNMTTVDDIQRQVWDYKRNLEQIQQALDLLVMNNGGSASVMVIVNRMCQRQQLLGDQLNELDGFLDSTHAVLGQTVKVNTYMASVDTILKTNQSLGSRLGDSLLSTGGEVVYQEEIWALASSAIQLWQHAGSHIPYPASNLVVNDLVRWNVLVAYGGVMTAMVQLVVGDLDAYTKRAEWEKQWLLDMDGLEQAQQQLSLRLQQLDNDDAGGMEGDTMNIIRRYADYPFYRLEQHFIAMQQAYPVNRKIPLELKEQQQRLTVTTYGHVKSLCGLVTYLQTARQLKDKCDDMNATLDQEGVDASEDTVQQWMDDIKMHVEQELFVSLCEQRTQLWDGASVFGNENVQLVHDKARHMLRDLHDRLATTLKASQHTRLVHAYGKSATVLESTLHQLQDDLASLVNEHGKIISGGGGGYQGHEEALHIRWNEAKLNLEAIHGVSYKDVRCLFQLIQLQQEEPGVVARQSRLDILWQVVGQDMDRVQERVLFLEQWRDLSSSLDKVQSMLMPLDQWMDGTTLAINGDDRESVKFLSRIYQEAHAKLAVVRGVVLPCVADKHTMGVLLNRLDDLCRVVDGLRTALLCFAQKRAVDERAIVLNRLASWMDMPLFDYDGIQMVVTQQWNGLKTKAKTSKAIYDLVVPLLSLCQNRVILDSCKGDDNYDGLLEVCQESVDSLSKVVEMEQQCLEGLLSNAFECGKQASALFLGLDRIARDLADFVLGGTINELVDWQLDIHVWQYKMAHYEKTELYAFLDKVKCWLLWTDGPSGDADDVLNTLGEYVRRCMQVLVQEVEKRWGDIKAELGNATTDTASWQLKKVAERQWQDFLELLENVRNRTMVLVSGFYHDDDDSVLLSQEQDLMEAQQTLTTLEYETRPMLTMKANEVKAALDALATTWIDHGDVDRALHGWEQTLQLHQQHLHHNISLCQYWAAAAEVHGYLCMLELLLDEEKTKFKVYMEALDTSLEKTRQAATSMEGSGRTEYALLVAKRNKLERQFNAHHRWLGAPASGGLQRSRKISLPSKMPSQNLMGRTPNAYVADPQNDLDMEIGRIVNRVPYKVELNMVPGEAGRYRFGAKLVYCRILKSRMVMVRVGGGWTELSQFLRDHALLVGNRSTTTATTTTDRCQEVFLDTKRETSPTSGRPLLLPRMSQSTSTTTTPSSISGNAGYKDGDRYIAVDLQGYQHEMKMTPHDSNNANRRYS